MRWSTPNCNVCNDNQQDSNGLGRLTCWVHRSSCPPLDCAFYFQIQVNQRHQQRALPGRSSVSQREGERSSLSAGVIAKKGTHIRHTIDNISCRRKVNKKLLKRAFSRSHAVSTPDLENEYTPPVPARNEAYARLGLYRAIVCLN